MASIGILKSVTNSIYNNLPLSFVDLAVMYQLQKYYAMEY